MNTILNFQQFVGKTIVFVNDSSVNMVKITFSDGQVVEVYAECGSAPDSLPFLDIYEAKEANQ